MRRAMAEAEVGDDVYGEDPTVRVLEERVAALLGHEAALFVPSGTMGNQIGMRLVCEPGQEVLCDADAHVVTYEMGAAAAVFGISTRTVVTGGRLDAAQLVEQVRGRDDWHLTATAAIAVENTHNRGGGLVQPLDQLEELFAWSREHDVAVHLDGARLVNASVASGVPLATYGRLADTASVCLSKGLGAPVGSVLVGLGRADRRRPAVAQAARRRHAAGRRAGGGGAVRPGPPRRAAGRRPRARAACSPSGSAWTRRGWRPTSSSSTTSPAPMVAEAAKAQGVLVSQVEHARGCGWSRTWTSTAPASSGPRTSSPG